MYIYIYRNCSTRLVVLGGARSAGRPAERHGASWLARSGSLGAPSATWAPLLARSGLDWLALAAPGALAGSICPRLARSGCPCCPGWLDLAALCAPGRPSWLDLAANDCPIDTISKKNRFAYRRSCFDAACFVRSGTFRHASKLVCYKIYQDGRQIKGIYQDGRSGQLFSKFQTAEKSRGWFRFR